jgi:repressor LexA
MHKYQEEILKVAKEMDVSSLSLRELGSKIGIKDKPQLVKHHFDQLVKKGLLYSDKFGRKKIADARGYVINEIFNIPLTGMANCGPAMQLAHQNIDGYLKISSKVLGRKKPNGLFAVKVIGNSMNSAKDLKGGPAEEGDYVIADCGKTDPQNGDYVLSIIDDAANIKRFYKDDGEIRLVSEATMDIPPIVLHEDDVNSKGYLVNGVVLRVIKN